MQLSLQNKFLLPTICIIIFFMIILSSVTYMKSSNALKNSIEGRVSHVSRSIAAQIDSWLGERRHDIENFSLNRQFIRALTTADPQVLRDTNAQLAALARKNPYYEFIALADRLGHP